MITVNESLDLYLDGLDADERLSAKTRFDYRHYAQDYVRPLLGGKKVRDLTPEAVVAWQRALTKRAIRITAAARTGRRHARDGQAVPPQGFPATRAASVGRCLPGVGWGP